MDFILFLFFTMFHSIVQADTELTRWLRLAINSQKYSYLSPECKDYGHETSCLT